MILILGHRGCRGAGNPPENSLAAFQAAIDQNADGVELDVFLSKDKKLIVFHDDTMERMTEGTGNVTAHTLTELKKLHLKDSSGKLTAEKIPTLDELLDLIEKSGKKKFLVNIEIKGLGIARHVIETIKQRLKEGWDKNNLIVSSFDMKSLEEMRAHQKDIAVGALLEGGKEPWDINAPQLEDLLGRIKTLQANTVNITLPSINENTVSMIKKYGAQLVAWTCNEKNPATFSKAECDAVKQRLQGVDVLITDYPAQMRAMLKK